MMGRMKLDRWNGKKVSLTLCRRVLMKKGVVKENKRRKVLGYEKRTIAEVSRVRS